MGEGGQRGEGEVSEGRGGQHCQRGAASGRRRYAGDRTVCVILCLMRKRGRERGISVDRRGGGGGGKRIIKLGEWASTEVDEEALEPEGG